MKKNDSIRPGIMFYFDMFHPLRCLSDASLGRLLRAAMTYGETGVLPEFKGQMSSIWGYLQVKIDLDGQRYMDALLRQRYAGYCSSQKRAKLPHLPFDQWKEQMEANNDQIQPQATMVNHCQPTTTPNVTPTLTITPTPTLTPDATPSPTAKETGECNIQADKPPAPSRFSPPSVQDVKDYCQSQGYAMDAERFVDFYGSKGWMVGKNRMKDWKAAVRNWVKREKEEEQTHDQHKSELADLAKSIGVRL